MNNVYDALETCLQEIERGADVDTVLFRYPEFMEELRPLLETAVKAKNAAINSPSPDVVRRNRARVLGHAAQLREAKAKPWHGFWSVSIRRTLVSLAVITILFIGSTGLVRAASTTVPGDNLYPVKRTWESVNVLFTFDVRAREALEVEHENERLEELSELFRDGRSANVDFVGLVTRQDGILWLVSNIKVEVSAQTDLHDGPIKEGDAVRVRGVTRSDWTVLAERVDLLDAGVPLPDADDNASEFEQDNEGNENESNEDNSGPGSGNEAPETESNENSNVEPEEVSLEGTVDSVNGNIVVVDGQPMNISGAEVRGDPAAGRRVKVEGYFNSDGVFIVTKIEFLEDNSGREDSGSDDQDNDSNDDSNDNGDDDNGNDDDDDNSGGGGGGGNNNNDDDSGGGNDDDDD
jgi:hypothetical protein